MVFIDDKRSLVLHSRSIAASFLFPFLWGIAAWFGGRFFLFFVFGQSDVFGFFWVAAHWFFVVMFSLRANKKFKRVNWYLIRDFKTGKVSVDVWYSKGIFVVISMTTIIYFLGALFTFSKLSL